MSAESPAVKALFDATVSMVKAGKTALADGWNISVDVPVLVTEALKDALVAIEQGPKAIAEWQANPFSAIQVTIQGLIEIVDALK